VEWDNCEVKNVPANADKVGEKFHFEHEHEKHSIRNSGKQDIQFWRNKEW